MERFPSVTPDVGEELFGAGIVGVFYLIYMLAMMAINVGTYVLQSVSLYTISKRRGINRPWLSWIPVGSAWILGCISDQYQYVVKGRVKNKRKALLVLNILMGVALIAVYVLLIIFMIQAIGMPEGGMESMGEAALAMGSALGMLGLSVVMSGLAIAVSVIRYIALYDLYTSCEPKNSVLYLVLGILVNITLPLFLFICRNKDLGMPPRKPEPAAFIPQQPVEPQWQPTEPPKEPWENNPEE